MKEIRARTLHDMWMRTDPAYRREYQALEPGFALIEAISRHAPMAISTSLRRSSRAHGSHAGGDRSAGERAHEGFDRNAGAPRQTDRHAVAQFVRAGGDRGNKLAACASA